ncbi:serine hydrolase domain-containing protein [Actinokineospora enzanensis]|uniref:serine hydrolase domain-containing protein n=1 Tax=Actinokineospora enzanensis TaxID=155975 RepID=UPI00035D24A9|nr:serine hydrolase domain-containing protein [Actinokineospora enzanensis]
MAAVLGTGLIGAPAGAETTGGGGHDREALHKAVVDIGGMIGIAGIQVRFHDERGVWADSAGVRELGRPGKPATDGRFRAGSITKTFISTVVLQLVAEGRVKLDDPLRDYLPDYGLDGRITVRMMLQHTSGIFNYTGENRPDGTLDPGIPMEGQTWVDTRFHTYRPADLIRLALSKPANFEPGTRWSYSNTNYILAGQLIERVTGTSYATQVERRVLRPLGLRDTTLPGTDPDIRGPHAHGYYNYLRDDKPVTVDVTRLNPSAAGSAGELVTTTRDLDTFLSALLGGKILPPALVAEMRTALPTGPVSAYGLGLEADRLAPGCDVVGHTGSIQGYTSVMFATADGRRQVELSVTVGALDPRDTQSLPKASAAARDLIVAGLCGDSA